METREYEQTARVRCTLWPKTYYEWHEVWPNPPETTGAEVDTTLDNIDLDFDQNLRTTTGHDLIRGTICRRILCCVFHDETLIK